MDTTLKYSIKKKKIWVAGHNGMVGSSLLRRLAKEDCDILCAARSDLDLRNQHDVSAWVRKNKPQAIIIAAATVGGILSNINYPANFLYDNLMIASNIIHTAHINKVEKLLFIGSACVYPKDADQPISEESLLTGPLEPTNEPHAIAKLAAIKMCQAYRTQYGSDFIAAQPNNLFGPGDDFDPNSSHVVPALIGKAHRAKQDAALALEIWGSGSVRRELMYVDDLADAVVYLLKNYSDSVPINIGSGQEFTIKELAEEICQVIDYRGGLEFDRTKPDGVKRKLLDRRLMEKLGWKAKTPLREGLKKTFDWYCKHELKQGQI
jgi:GDP-L-fucose synthase